MEFFEYKFTSNALCMGERIKAGLVRPCARTIRYSQITGALKKKFGNIDIHSVGFLIENRENNLVDYIVYSPRDRCLNTSKLPLRVEILTNVLGEVYISKNEDSEKLPDKFDITVGALISKGLGLCKMEKISVIDNYRKELGFLKVRVPIDKKHLFDIAEPSTIYQPKYGYLFFPISQTEGYYVKSLFEGSYVVAPPFLIKKE